MDDGGRILIPERKMGTEKETVGRNGWNKLAAGGLAGGKYPFFRVCLIQIAFVRKVIVFFSWYRPDIRGM